MNTHDSVITIDCQYVEPERAAAYLLIEDGEAAFVDNNTRFAVPRLLNALESAGLEPRQVKYAIVTHVHLDHAAGTASLLEACPNAIALAHPIAVRHLVRPARLVASVKRVYGETLFEQLYGEIDPCPADRVRAVEDGEVAELGGRALKFLHTPGHASHHISIHDSRSGGVFTGDAFGVAYPFTSRNGRQYLFCSSPPTDFDPAASHRSVERIMGLSPARLYPTHFGEYKASVREAAQLMTESIEALASVLERMRTSPRSGAALAEDCEQAVRDALRQHAAGKGYELGEEQWARLEHDIRINAAGLAWRLERERTA